MLKIQVEKITKELTSREQAGFIHIDYHNLESLNKLYVSTSKTGKVINIYHNYLVKKYPNDIQKMIDNFSGNNSAEGYQKEFIFLLALNYPLYYQLKHINLNGYQIKFMQSPSISIDLQNVHTLLENNRFELSDAIESQLKNQQQMDLYQQIKKLYLQESLISYNYNLL